MLGCDGCTKCCELIGVPEIQKPRGELCQHARPGVGCALHLKQGGPGQPQSCDYFFCSWLASQRITSAQAEKHAAERGYDPRMPPEMRPDRCHVVFGPCDDQVRNRLYVNVDPKHPDAWREPEVVRWLTRFVANGVDVVLFVGDASAQLKVGCRTVNVKPASEQP